MTTVGRLCALTLLAGATLGGQEVRPRARELGITPGVFAPGAHNAITDVAGVRVGHTTVTSGDSINTGVTAILPHAGNIFASRVPAAIHVGNGFGKFLGTTQVTELGELETPVLLTCTLCVWRAADAMVAWLLAQPGMESVRSINPVIGETNDGGLNDIRARPIAPADVVGALERADTGRVEEGSVGAGRGTQAFGWKGGIGTSSRRLPAQLGGWTVGVLVQTNFGGVLQVEGIPVGEELGRYSYRNLLMRERGDGSVIIVIATDAPLTPRQLERVAARGIMGLARTGADASNGSGDYVLAFSTAASVRRTPGGGMLRRQEVLVNDAISPVFEAAIEATEEAIYNSLLAATTVRARGRTAEALPIDDLRRLIARYRGGAN
jgi:D-aminopeptidase